MIILSHRGYWKTVKEKNREIAFHRSFNLAFGTETDVRDCNGRLVISHDMPNGSEITLMDFLNILGNRNLPLALNIKADGLVLPLMNVMKNANITNWFVFDMSIPDMRTYLQAKLPVFVRMSEVEQESAWLEHATGIWLDSFSDTWYDIHLVDRLLRNGKRVCIVSSELHGRPFEPLWEMLRSLAADPLLMLCTDHPEHARQFFGEPE